MGKIALVFSGQGAQYPGMGKELYDCSPAAKAVYDMADSIREGTSNQCFNGTKEELSVTVNTQPTVFTADLAAAEAVKEKGIKIDYVAGFSLGEIAALGFSGIMSYVSFRSSFTLSKRSPKSSATIGRSPSFSFIILKNSMPGPSYQSPPIAFSAG